MLLRHRTPPQKRISNSNKRFNVARWGRQSGKTTFGIDRMVQKPLIGPRDGVYWYLLQTYAAADIAYHRFCANLHKSPLLVRTHDSKRFAVLDGGPTIFFKSGNNREDLRGETLHGGVLDELRQQPSDLWPLIIRPMLARTHQIDPSYGWADFLSTTNGYDHFYDLWNQAVANPDEWGTFHAPSSEAWWWTPKEIASAKASMSDLQFKQEIMAEFVNIFSGQAYGAYSGFNERMDSPFNVGERVSPYMPVHLFCDFNVQPMHWVLGQEFRKVIHCHDEVYVKRIEDPYDPHRILLEKLKALPFDVNHLGLHVIGDATGKATQRTSAKSDYELLFSFLQSSNIRYVNRVTEVNPAVKERVNNVNARLKNSNGQINLTINPKACPHLKRDLERQAWKENGADLDPGPENDIGHGSDALGYGVSVLAPLQVSGQAGLLRVINNK